MNPDWQKLVEALRDELKEYGAIRNILDEQQKSIFVRDAEKTAGLGAALNVQIEVAANYRRRREKLMRDIAQYHELPLHTPLADMKAVFPKNAQELLKALTHEVNSMLNILRRRSRQNHLLLARTCELMEKTLSILRPGSVVRTYSSRGAVSLQLGPVGSHIQTSG